MKKEIMKSQIALENINRVKTIIERINEQIADAYNNDEIELLNDRLDFMNKHINSLQKEYERLLENDSPYYVEGSLNYYKEKFKGLNSRDLDSSFTTQVVNCIESERMKNKLSAVKNIVKAYQTRDVEIMEKIRKGI